jgi:hypothetical protein
MDALGLSISGAGLLMSALALLADWLTKMR